MTTGLKAIIIVAGALAVLGLVLVLLPGPTATFGWFAYQPVGDFGFVGGAPLQESGPGSVDRAPDNLA
ncbi:hypothetical protein ACFCVO_17325 [Agromyces sp. NPDC056379]|uniref:hypothetical protein n=1 Tax=unclassified Agromyces TaxID=2639701 RepID=UPI0035E124BE